MNNSVEFDDNLLEEIFENERKTCEKTDNSGQIYTVHLFKGASKGLSLSKSFEFKLNAKNY